MSATLAPGSASDRFLLISMCYDDRYLKTALVGGMAAELELFPHAFSYVRLITENPPTPGNASVGATDRSWWGCARVESVLLQKIFCQLCKLNAVDS